jgi:hypothetical protein
MKKKVDSQEEQPGEKSIDPKYASESHCFYLKALVYTKVG